MQILFQDIPTIPGIVKDFLKGNFSDAKGSVFSLENIQKQMQEKENSFSENQRNILVKALANQLLGVSLSEKQKENLRLLGEENSFTIVTGHQLNLFTGPVFFIYKILQTIKTCRFLKEKIADKNFIPVFWMATEDHDFEEINHFKTQNNFYQIHAKSGGAVGRIIIENQNFIDEFEKEFKDDVYGTELIRWIKEAYAIGNTLSEATKILVNRLFSEYGLLIIDGDDDALKSQMASVFEDELLNESLYHHSQKRVQEISEKYGKVQVNPREINLFYLSKTRNRIEKHQQNFKVLETEIEFSASEIQNQIQHISPNALMRPVYQEKILPNLAYIGGNAEIAYWLELQDYFDYLKIPFPVLIPRNSMLFITEKIGKKMDKLGLLIEDFFKNFSQIINDTLLSDSEILVTLEEKEKEIRNSFAVIKNKAVLTDKTFENLVNAEETRQLKSFDRMKKRLLRAEKIKQNEKLERMHALFQEVHPGGNWQERVYNFSVFYAEHGRKWMDEVLEKMDVENSSLIISKI